MEPLDELFQKYIMRKPEIDIILFKILGLGGILVSIVSAVYNLCMHSYMNAGIIFSAIVLSVILLWFVEQTGKYVIGYLIIVVCVFLGLFTVLYLRSGGMDGSLPFFFVFSLIFSFLMFRNRLLIVVIVVEAVYYLGLGIVTYRHPELVTPFNSELSRLMSQMFGFLCSSLIMGLIILYYINEFKKQKKIADDASRAKSVFLANMSHEIRTPINAIVGFNEIILRESEDITTLEYAENIKTAGKQLQDVVNQILDFSRLDSGKEQVLEMDYRLSDLVYELRIYLQEATKQKALDFIVDVDDSINDNLRGDKEKLSRILMNLLSNAVKYTNEGMVELKIQKLEGDDKTQRLHFEVRDTGVGIPPEDMGKLFNNYERADLLKNRKIQGTGLGLAIAQHLTGLMDSHIEVDSVYSHGTIFSFDIEQKIGEDCDGFAELSDEETDNFIAPDASILVVDDNEMNRVVIKTLLSNTMMKVDTVESAVQCFEKLKNKSYDAILMDYMMPEMDGLEAMHYIRREEEKRGLYTPIFVLTADVAEDAEKKLIDQGFDSYIAKPVNIHVLMSILSEYLPEDKVIRSTISAKRRITDDVLEAYEERLAVSDVSIKSGMRYASDDFEQYMRVAGFFVDNGMRCIEEYPKLIQEMNYDKLRLFNHSLKGNAKAVGANDLYRICRNLEERCKKSDEEYLRESTGLLLVELNRAVAGLSEFIEMYSIMNNSNQREDDSLYKEEDDEQSEMNHNELIDALYNDVTLYQKRSALKRIDEIRGMVDEPKLGAWLDRLEDMIKNADFDTAIELMDNYKL